MNGLANKGVKGPSKRYPLNMRVTRDLRERIERAAKANGRSLSQEVEFLVEKAFIYEEMSVFLDRTVALMKLILSCKGSP